MTDLPGFPVDDATLDLLWTALHPGEGAERTSLDDLLTLMSQLGGSDPTAVASTEVIPHPFIPGESVEVNVMRDAAYHPNDVIAALITEVRWLRRRVADQISFAHEYRDMWGVEPSWFEVVAYSHRGSGDDL